MRNFNELNDKLDKLWNDMSNDFDTPYVQVMVDYEFKRNEMIIAAGFTVEEFDNFLNEETLLFYEKMRQEVDDQIDEEPVTTRTSSSIVHMPDSVEPDDYRFEMIYHEPDSGNQSLLTFIAPPPVYCTGVTIAVNDEMPKMPKLIHMVRRLFPMIVGRELDMSKDDQNTWIVSNETGVPVYRWNEDADDWK